MIKGTGSRLENETNVLWNEAEDTCIIETASPQVFRLLSRRGYKPELERTNRARFVIPKSRISIRSPKTARRRQTRPPVLHAKPQPRSQSPENEGAPLAE